ncbi:MAG: hypothetical protein RLZZ373_1625 [Pseudomonadota bacterium]|jgi:hypothetical protein
MTTHSPRPIPATAARLAQRAADARSLYLMSPHPLRVTSTGEALVVRDHEGQVVRFPVARVLRVVCTDTAEWSGAALVLCQQRGITITWLDGHGEALGHLWPTRSRPVDLAEALGALASESADWSASYDNWLRHQRLHVLQHWAGERARAGQPVHAPEWEQAKRQYVYLGQTADVLPPVLHGMAAALVAARLAECGVLPHYWCAVGEPVALAQDLTRLVWAEMNLGAGALAAAVEQPREAVAIFERWSVTRAGAIHAHLANLRAHALRELAV